MLDIHPQFRKNFWLLAAAATLFLLLLLMPEPEGMQPEAKKMLAVAALLSALWIGEVISLAVTSLLPLALFPLLGIMPSKEVGPHYTNHIVFLFLGGIMIALAMEKWNFHKRMALNIILKIGARPKQIVLGFMIATAFISLWISNTAATMMIFPVATAVVHQIAAGARIAGQQDETTAQRVKSNLGAVLMLALAYAASIGGLGTLIGTAPNIVFAGLYKKLFPGNPEVEFFQWMILGIPAVLILLPVFWLYLCRAAADFDLNSIEYTGTGNIIHDELAALGPMSRAEKYIAAVFFTASLLWIFRKPIPCGSFTLPGWGGLFANPDMLHDATVAMGMGLLLFILPLSLRQGVMRRGEREFFVLDWETVEKGVPWGVLLLFGGGFALAAGFTKTGLDQWLGNHLTALQLLPGWLVIFAVAIFVTLLSELTSNTATAMMVLPVLASTATAIHMHPLLLMLPAAFASSLGFMMPVGTPPNAIVFSSGWISMRKMVKAGLALDLIGAVVISALAALLVPVFFIH